MTRTGTSQVLPHPKRMNTHWVSEQRIFRVLVRGRFHDLSENARGALVAAREEHDVSRAAYTDEGTLTYDSQIDAFALRYEVRIESSLPDDVAAQRALQEADMFLGAMGYGHRGLRVAATDMADVWLN
jgi:hypothetical protein